MGLFTCRECGGMVSSEAVRCPHCGVSVNRGSAFANAHTDTQIKPNNWLAWSVLSTLFCCLPLGVVGIVFASKVDAAWAAGNYEGARYSAEKAKMFVYMSAGIGIAVYLLIFGALALDQCDIL
ncbi:MAG: CD225/dispanin family protein [Alistipes sp.]|nr:CD225/dispanin family protein [Alistipes sp.]